MKLHGLQTDERQRMWYSAEEKGVWYLIEKEALEDAAKCAYRAREKENSLPQEFQAVEPTSWEWLAWYAQTVSPRMEGMASAYLDGTVVVPKYQRLQEANMRLLVYAYMATINKFIAILFADGTSACFTLFPDEQDRNDFYSLFNEIRHAGGDNCVCVGCRG